MSRKSTGSRIFYSLITVWLFCLLVYVRNKGRIHAASRAGHHISKRWSSRDEPLPPDAEIAPPIEGDDTMNGNVLPEGQLVCMRKPAKGDRDRDIPGGESKGRRDTASSSRDVIDLNLPEPAKKAPLVGCCPRGDPGGEPFRDGSACCVATVYNATTHMCCHDKNMVLETTAESINYCYAAGCLQSDLGVSNKRPMRSECKLNKQQSPVLCRFYCPVGSRVRGNKMSKCLGGSWTTLPTCCEGCPPTFRQDIWFVVDLNFDAGVGPQADVRSFIKGLLSYLPVSQEAVRVAATAFTSKVLLGKRLWWPLSAHGSHVEVNKAIDGLEDSSKDNERNAGKALKWVAENAFTGKMGDRVDVENVVVYIATGNPTDSIVEEMEELSGRVRLMVVTVGEGATSPVFDSVSDRSPENRIHVESFYELDAQNKLFYELFCDDHCLQST